MRTVWSCFEQSTESVLPLELTRLDLPPHHWTAVAFWPLYTRTPPTPVLPLHILAALTLCVQLAFIFNKKSLTYQPEIIPLLQL